MSRLALEAKDSATRMRRWADELSEADPTGARWTRKDADAIEAKAEIALSRSSYTTGLPETGNGGELVALPESETFAIAVAVRDPPDMLAQSASTQRMELAAETDALSLGLDAANAIKARDSIEQMLMHQAAAAHKLAMRFMTRLPVHRVVAGRSTPGTQRHGQLIALKRARSACTGGWQASWGHSTIAVLTVQRRRSGAKGSRPGYPPQQVASVGKAGGQAIVAGTGQGRRRKVGGYQWGHE